MFMRMLPKVLHSYFAQRSNTTFAYIWTLQTIQTLIGFNSYCVLLLLVEEFSSPVHFMTFVVDLIKWFRGPDVPRSKTSFSSNAASIFHHK